MWCGALLGAVTQMDEKHTVTIIMSTRRCRRAILSKQRQYSANHCTKKNKQINETHTHALDSFCGAMSKRWPRMSLYNMFGGSETNERTAAETQRNGFASTFQVVYHATNEHKHRTRRAQPVDPPACERAILTRASDERAPSICSPVCTRFTCVLCARNNNRVG